MSFWTVSANLDSRKYLVGLIVGQDFVGVFLCSRLTTRGWSCVPCCPNAIYGGFKTYQILLRWKFVVASHLLCIRTLRVVGSVFRRVLSSCYRYLNDLCGVDSSYTKIGVNQNQLRSVWMLRPFVMDLRKLASSLHEMMVSASGEFWDVLDTFWHEMDAKTEFKT